MFIFAILHFHFSFSRKAVQVLIASFSPQSKTMPLAVTPIKKIRIAEDCAGLGTGFCTFKRTAHYLNHKRSVKLEPRRRKQKKQRHRIKIDPVYMSENDKALRQFLQHKWALTKIVQDSSLGSDARGDTLLGKDGDIDVYIAGNSCQPFSQQGKNGGRKDMRSNTTRDSVDFIKHRRPKCFIMEQVKNITSKKHSKWLEQRVLRIIKNLKRKDGKKLYKVRKEIYDSQKFKSPQIRKRLYITGVRTDIPCLRRFKMPTGSNRRPKSLASLVASSTTSGHQIEDWELTMTERRNWTAIMQALKDRKDVKYPVIGDFQQSRAFGISWQDRKCMTITKSRAQARAFWIIDRSRDGSGFSKRRLAVCDYASLMGWDKKSQTHYLGINQFHCPRNANQPLPVLLKGVNYGSKLSQAQLLAGLGNSFSVPVFSAITENMLKCFTGQVNSDSEDSDSGECSNDEECIPEHVQNPAIGKKRRISPTVMKAVAKHKACNLKDLRERIERDVKYPPWAMPTLGLAWSDQLD